MADIGLVSQRWVKTRQGCHGNTIHLLLVLLGKQGNGLCALGERNDELSTHHQPHGDFRLEMEGGDQTEVGGEEGEPKTLRLQALHQLLRIRNLPQGLYQLAVAVGSNGRVRPEGLSVKLQQFLVL